MSLNIKWMNKVVSQLNPKEYTVLYVALVGSCPLGQWKSIVGVGKHSHRVDLKITIGFINSKIWQWASYYAKVCQPHHHALLVMQVGVAKSLKFRKYHFRVSFSPNFKRCIFKIYQDLNLINNLNRTYFTLILTLKFWIQIYIRVTKVVIAAI